MNCRNCGAELKTDAKFCSSCGAPVLTTALERFEQAIAFVQAKEKFMMDKNFEGVDPDTVVKKIMYQTMDKTIREKLSDEDNAKLDSANEKRSVIEKLKEDRQNGMLTEEELEEIIGLKEFQDYTAVS